MQKFTWKSRINVSSRKKYVDNIFKNRNNTVNNNNNINSNVDEKTDKEHNPNLPARVQKEQNIFLRVLGLIKKLINY